MKRVVRLLFVTKQRQQNGYLHTARMKVMKSCAVCLMLAVAGVFHYTEADLPYCRRLNNAPHMRAYCYEVTTYVDCKDNCTSLILQPQYVTADCPWGNYGHFITNTLDNHCQGEITIDKCGLFCSNTPTNGSDRVVGWNCCKSCVEICGRVPTRDINFEDRYPGLYPRDTS